MCEDQPEGLGRSEDLPEDLGRNEDLLDCVSMNKNLKVTMYMSVLAASN